MTNELAYMLFVSIIVWLGFTVFVSVGEMVFHLLYRFVKPFRRYIDKAVESLPEWHNNAQ